MKNAECSTSFESAWEALKRDFEALCSQVENRARREASSALSQIFRRLRHYEREEQWIAALRDGAALGAREFAIFAVSDGTIRLRGQHNLSLPEDLAFPSTTAKAFAAAVESQDAVVALRTAAEVGAVLGTEHPSRAHLFPISNAGRIVAILFAADGPELDAPVLELVASMASAVLERRLNQTIHSQIAPAPSANAPREAVARRLPAWAALSEADRILHAKAQRFSRVAVAQMLLARPAACRAGREQNNVYLFLQSEIDKARETYSRQYMTKPSMVDYLHLELIRSAADGDETKLGAEYPGHFG